MSGWVPAGSDVSDMETRRESAGGPEYRTAGPERILTREEAQALHDSALATAETWGRETRPERPIQFFPRKSRLPVITYVPTVEYPLHNVDPVEIDEERDAFLTELLAKRKERA